MSTENEFIFRTVACFLCGFTIAALVHLFFRCLLLVRESRRRGYGQKTFFMVFETIGIATSVTMLGYIIYACIKW